VDWEREFAYLTTPKTRPSGSDLYNSLRGSGMDKVQADALANLFVVALDRIAELEHAMCRTIASNLEQVPAPQLPLRGR
jgi:hypothetical protein